MYGLNKNMVGLLLLVFLILTANGLSCPAKSVIKRPSHQRISRITNFISSKSIQHRLNQQHDTSLKLSADATAELASRTISHMPNLKLLLSIGTLSASSILSPAIAGGFLSGSLHAITGPDHLAAILPSSIGLSGFQGMRIGCIWGLGHGLSAMIVGALAFVLRGTVSNRFKFMETISSLAENIVGFSLVAIGVLGLKENLEVSESIEIASKPRNFRAVFLNGMLHGFSWDGAPSLAPAIAMKSWQPTAAFLLYYCVGTMFAMCIASGMLSEGSRRLGDVSGNPKFSRNISMGSSVLAIVLGMFWILKSRLM